MAVIWVPSSKDIRKKLSSVTLPADFNINFGGEYQEQKESFQELILVLILSLVLVYMVMVCLYESFRDPFVVMFAVPPAAIGVIWLLFLTGTTFNFQSFIGCIMLGGIVVNNAIVLVDHINLLRVEKLSPAITETYEEEKAKFDPGFVSNFSLSRQNTRSPPRTSGALTGSTSSQIYLDAGVSRFSPQGTTFSAGLSTEKDWSSLYGNQHTTRLGITVTQAVLKGASSEANLAKIR